MSVLKDIFEKAHHKHLELRRLETCFHAFSGAIVESLRERNYRLVGFDSGQIAAPFGPPRGDFLQVHFEQPDGDRFDIRLEPYRRTPTFLLSIGPVAEIFFTLKQHISDPDAITSAQSAQMRQGVGRFLGSMSAHDDLKSGCALSEPGNLRFVLHGAEVVTSINLIVNLREYSAGPLDYDKDKLGQTLDAVIYGLEKFTAGLMERHQTAVP